MKRLLLAIGLIPWLATACGNSTPEVAGTYDVISTDCEDPASEFKVTQDGDKITLSFEGDSPLVGDVDEDGTFEVFLGQGTCSGKFDDNEAFKVTCESGSDSCFYNVERI